MILTALLQKFYSLFQNFKAKIMLFSWWKLKIRCQIERLNLVIEEPKAEGNGSLRLEHFHLVEKFRCYPWKMKELQWRNAVLPFRERKRREIPVRGRRRWFIEGKLDGCLFNLTQLRVYLLELGLSLDGVGQRKKEEKREEKEE